MAKPEFRDYYNYNGNVGDLRYNPHANIYEVMKCGGWEPLIQPVNPDYTMKPDTHGIIDKMGGFYRWEDIVDVILIVMMENGMISDIEQFKRKLTAKMNAGHLANQLEQME